MKFLECTVYFLITGAVGFVLGRLLPKRWFRAEKFPYCSFSFERQGRIYERIGIRYWHKKVVDMSRLLPFCMPPKNLRGQYDKRLPRMLQETCVAETVHVLLCVSGLYCMRLWPGVGGMVVWVLYTVVFNLPYILIQRYNRPRLLHLQTRLQCRKRRGELGCAF